MLGATFGHLGGEDSVVRSRVGGGITAMGGWQRLCEVFGRIGTPLVCIAGDLLGLRCEIQASFGGMIIFEVKMGGESWVGLWIGLNCM